MVTRFSLYLMWFRYRLRYQPIWVWVSISDLNQNSGFGHTLVNIIKQFIFELGIPVVITNMTTLPLRLIVKPCAPIKEADYKVTVSTNKPAVSLLDLFPGKLIFILTALKI